MSRRQAGSAHRSGASISASGGGRHGLPRRATRAVTRTGRPRLAGRRLSAPTFVIAGSAGADLPRRSWSSRRTVSHPGQSSSGSARAYSTTPRGTAARGSTRTVPRRTHAADRGLSPAREAGPGGAVPRDAMVAAPRTARHLRRRSPTMRTGGIDRRRRDAPGGVLAHPPPITSPPRIRARGRRRRPRTRNATSPADRRS